MCPWESASVCWTTETAESHGKQTGEGHTHTHTHSFTHTPTPSLSLFCRHKSQTHTLSVKYTHTPSLSLSLSLSFVSLYSHTQITSIFSLSCTHTLHQASVRFNSSLAVNAQMRTKIDHLRQEKAVFEGIHRKLQKVSVTPHDRTITMQH